ncbi:MAG: hypothetical protein LQ342_002491 [Letrouitia transgressa]|nr:MAG: hypothetical protein LQ342_002491 [Letrouitia transgressa]
MIMCGIRLSNRAQIYHPLNNKRREIRLLHVSPRQKNRELIQCHLSAASLDDRPVYEALSYAWGDPRARKSIELCGRPFRVRKNLWTALKAIHLSDTSRTIWIDAICINQDDKEERSQQVKLMREVYRGAEKVIAWLGDDTDDVEHAFGVIEAMSDFPNLHFDPEIPPHHDLAVLEPESIESLVRFLNRDWWKRVWTFQEMALAFRLEIRCSRRTLTGEKLAAARESFWNHNTCCYSAYSGEYPGDPIADLDKYFSPLTRMYQYANMTDDFVFPSIMATFRQRQCTNPQDKVYGYLGLAFGRFRSFVEPNYNKDPGLVFEETALRIMEKIGSLGPFSLLEGPKSNDIICPSWVPTWEEFEHDFLFEAHYLRFSWLITFNACRQKSLDMSLLCQGKLKVRGVIVDRIVSDARVPPSHPIKHQTPIFDQWRALARCSNAPYVDPRSTREEAFWLTLLNGSLHEGRRRVPEPEDGEASSTANEVNETNLAREDLSRPANEDRTVLPVHGSAGTPPPPEEVDSRQWHSWWVFMHSPSDFLDLEGLQFNTCVTAATVNRKFFMTAEGWMGTGPPTARQNDMVVVLNGGLVPYVLRPTWSEMSHAGTTYSEFTILGDCYVHGIMYGEAMDRLDAGVYTEQEFVLV